MRAGLRLTAYSMTHGTGFCQRTGYDGAGKTRELKSLFFADVKKTYDFNERQFFQGLPMCYGFLNITHAFPNVVVLSASTIKTLIKLCRGLMRVGGGGGGVSIKCPPSHTLHQVVHPPFLLIKFCIINY